MIEGIADITTMPQPQPTPPPESPIADIGAPGDAVRDPSSGELRLGDVLFLDPARLDAMGDEVDLVALATDDYGGPIIITGWWTGYGSGGGGGGGGGGWDSNGNDYSHGGDSSGDSELMTDNHQLTADADDTPCVDEVPVGVNLDHLNNLAKYMGNVLASLHQETGHEWGAFIYRGSDGELYQSPPFTAGHPDNLDGAKVMLPSGAHIVGYLHTHAEHEMMNQTLVSGYDREYISRLMEGVGTVTADQKLMTYIVTKDEEASYHVYVYDKSQRNATRTGCDL